MPSHLSLLDFVQRRAQFAGAQILDVGDPWFLQVDKFCAETEASGRPYRSFAHFDYLGLSRHPNVRTAAREALQEHGTSVSASRLVGGERVMQRELELELADFVGHEDSVVLSSGYVTNVSLLSHLLSRHDLILYDELIHNSIQTGLSASRATAKSFRHNDLSDLDAILAAERGGFRQCLIIVESIYSMDGDLVDLPHLIEVKNRHNCWVLIDEANSLGTLGATGRGICEHYGVSPSEIDLMTGTLSKALASAGGFIAASKPVIWWLRYTLPAFVFSVGISPVATAAAKAALDVVSAESDRVQLQQQRSEFFLKTAKAYGLNTGDAIGRGIVPLLMPDFRSALTVSKRLLDAGIYVPPILRVGVPNDKPRLRFFVCSTHEQDEIEQAIHIVSETLGTSAASSDVLTGR
jgi:8-amino-7-oxononanoate synthase